VDSPVSVDFHSLNKH